MSDCTELYAQGESQRYRGGNSINSPAATTGSQVEVAKQEKHKPEKYCVWLVWGLGFLLVCLFFPSVSSAQGEVEGVETSEEALV